MVMACVRRKWQDMPGPSSAAQATLGITAHDDREHRRPGSDAPENEARTLSAEAKRPCGVNKCQTILETWKQFFDHCRQVHWPHPENTRLEEYNPYNPGQGSY